MMITRVSADGTVKNIVMLSIVFDRIDLKKNVPCVLILFRLVKFSFYIHYMPVTSCSRVWTMAPFPKNGLSCYG